MSLISNVGTLTITAQSSSALSVLAASMSLGTWAQLSVSNQNALLGIGPTNGSMLPQDYKSHWCPASVTGGRYIDVIGTDHYGGTGPGMRHVRYRESTNLFELVEAGTSVLGDGHGFDHTAIDPSNGDLYHRNYEINGITVNVKPFGQTAWNPTDYVQSSGTNVATGTCLWTGTRTFGSGTGPVFLILSCTENLDVTNGGSATDGKFYGLSTLTKTFVYTATGRTPGMGTGFTGGGNYHQVACYSPVKNVAVYGGGNFAPRRLWKMTSTGAVTEIATLPTGTSAGVGVGGGGFGRLVPDPVTGNFLLLSNAQLWEYNPDTNTWAQKTSPPSGVINPDSNSWVCGVTLPDHGVVGFISQGNSANGTFYLYKNGASYTTTFSAVENPISESGRWTNGLATGLQWSNVRTSGGLAFGTQVPHSPPPYNDSLACLSGFPPDHYCQAVLSRGTITGLPEVELLLRATITANSARLYEVDILADGRVDLTRWNGSVNDFTIVVAPTSTNVSVANGAVWYAEARGNIITVKCNGNTCFTYDITNDPAPNRWTTGNPGMGFYIDSINGTPSASDAFAWTSYTAGSL